MNAIDRLREYQIFTLKLNNMILLSGLWPVTKPNLFNRMLPYLLFVSSFVSTFVVFNFCVLHKSDLKILSESMGALITLTATDLKILCLVFNWNDAKELRATLDNISERVLKDEVNRGPVLQKFITVRRMSTILIVMAFLAISLQIIEPLISLVVQWIHNIHPMEYHLPLPAIYPWPISGGSFLYYCHYAVETLGGGCVFFAACSVDALFPVHIFQMTGQLEAMSCQLDSLKDGDNYEATLRECARKHQMLLRCRDIIEKIYGPVIIWMLLTTAIVLCTLTFQLSKLENFAFGSICTDVAYMFSKMLQIFIYAWSGTSLTSASEKFADAIYIGNWPVTGRKRFMSSISIMLTQPPLVITACSYSVVSMEMFAKVLNTTVSYFLLLQTMDEKET